MLRVTPIYGSCWSPEGAAVAPQCTLVEYADCRVLLNVGWFPTSISGSHVDESFPALPPHDALILTDSSLECLGGLPLYYRQWQQQQQQYAAEDRAALPPIFATFPVVKMGQMTIYNDHAAISLDGGEPPFTLQDVDQVFAAITAIKYSHPQKLGPAAAPTLTISAHRAGHAVGAAFYVLRGLRDDTRVVLLTSAYHMAKEVHLDSATLLQHGSTPDVLVTRPGGPALRSLQALTVGTKQRPAALPPTLVTQARRQLTEAVLQVLRREGNVLLPSDAASRALELILLLNQHWERHRLGAAYHLVWLGPMVPNIGDFARSQLEWMSASVGQAFLDSQDGKDHHPWQLQCVTQCTSVAQVLSLMQDSPNPTCVVAAGASLEAGPARDLLLQWADTPENAILLTDSAQASLRPAHVRRQAVVTATEAEASTEEDALPGRPLAPDEAISPWTTAGQLLQAWAAAQRSGDQDLDQIPVDVAVRLTQSLQGTELAAFSAREEAARQVQLEQAKQEAILREVEFAKGQLRLGEEADKKVSVVATSRPRKKSRFDQSLFLKYSKPLHLSFEVREEAVGIGQKDATAKYGIGESVGRSGEIVEDDYGIAVLPESFTDIVSGVDPSKFSARIGEEVLRRGFGYGVTGPKQARSSNRLARVSEDEEDGDGDDMDEEAMEALDLSEGQGIVRGRNGRPPTKVTTVWRKLEVLAEVSYVPFEGRVDAKAARQSVRALQPREIIVLGGPSVDADETLHDEVGLLAQAAQSYAIGGNPVLTPSDGETAELNIGHAAYAVRLVDTPFVPLAERQVGTSLPDPVELYEVKLGPCTISKVDYVATGQKVAADGSIVLAPKSSSADAIPSIYLSSGEVLLTDLRAELIAQGMKAEYKTRQGYSQLIVNGHIVVKKEQSSGQMEVEGPLCEDFWTVRQVVCSQFVSL